MSGIRSAAASVAAFVSSSVALIATPAICGAFIGEAKTGLYFAGTVAVMTAGGLVGWFMRGGPLRGPTSVNVLPPSE